jgi:tetratricopeptide (TPR) repeat protein
MRTSTGRGRAALAVAAALMLAPFAAGDARAQGNPTEQAREHFTRGKQLFAAGEYRAAIGEFAAADKIAPSPLLEFNIALCHERLGERPEALRRFRLYLERVPGAPNRAEVEQKIARLESEQKAEADARREKPPAGGAVGPVPGGPPSPDGPSAPPTEKGKGPAEAAPPAATGDPELDRAARIDIGRLRAERRASAPPPPSRAATPPPPAPRGATPPARDEGEKKPSKPVYKEWWFWAAAGLGAIVLYVIVTSDSDSSDGRALMLPMGEAPRDAGQPGGAVLWRF